MIGPVSDGIGTRERPLSERFVLREILLTKRNGRVIMLWSCIALFFTRVVAQIEVLLIEPDWLPAMPAWYSGLLPYPALLPAQIALLILMCVIAVRCSDTGPRMVGARAIKTWRALALLYFCTMAVRLALCVYTYGADFYLHGAIPVAFHWVLALFVLCAAGQPEPDAQRDKQRAEGTVHPQTQA
jgi:hypothetical protein